MGLNLYQVDAAQHYKNNLIGAAIPYSNGSTSRRPFQESELGSDQWPKGLPSGQTEIVLPLVHRGHDATARPYYNVAWSGNMTAGSLACENGTLSLVDYTAKTARLTPTYTDSAYPFSGSYGPAPKIKYGIDSADTLAGTYAKNFVATYSGVSTASGDSMDATVKSVLTACSSSGRRVMRFVKANGVELGIYDPSTEDDINLPYANYATGSPWGGKLGSGCTQSSPHYKITLANRRLPNTPYTSLYSSNGDGLDNAAICTGMPIEDGVAICNDYGASPHWCEHWNASPAVTAYNADYARDHLNSTEYRVEVSNEVWNGGYIVAGQATYEAGYGDSIGAITDAQAAALRTSGTALTQVGIGNGKSAARYIEKVIEVYDTISARWALPRSGGGTKPAFKMLACWQNGIAGDGAALMLDYIPNGGTRALKDVVSAYGTSTYMSQNYVDLRLSAGLYNLGTGGLPRLFASLYLSSDYIASVVQDIRAVCDARSVEYFCYETGAEIMLDNDNSTNLDVARAFWQNSGIRDLYRYHFQRLEEASPGSVAVYNGGVAGTLGSRFPTEIILEAFSVDPTTSYMYLGLNDFASGNRYLFPLYVNAVAKAGAALNDVVALVRRRRKGSTITVTSPFKVVSQTDTTVSIGVLTPASFASAGTVSGTITETDATTVTATNDTAFTCNVVASGFFSASASFANYDITNNGRSVWTFSTIDGTFHLALGNTARSNGYVEFTFDYVDMTGVLVGFAGPSSSGTAGLHWYPDRIGWEQGGGLFCNGANLAAIPAFVTGKTGAFLLDSGHLWVKYDGQWYGAGAATLTQAQVNARTSGIDVSAFMTAAGGTVLPAVDTRYHSTGLTFRFADADFTGTKPTGASAWV